MSIGRLLAGIAVAAALIFATLWWFARPADVSSPAEPGGAGHAPGVSAPVADFAPPAAREAAAPTGGVEPLVSVPASARAQLATDFQRLRLPAGTLDRLANGEVADVAADLRSGSDDDATLALHQLARVCGARLGDTTLRAADAQHWMAAVPDGSTMLRIEATIDAQLAWSARFRSGCDSAGLLRGGELRTEAEARVTQCSSRGNPHCRAIVAKTLTGSESVAMLRGAAVLGSVDAQASLLDHLEQDSTGSPAQRRAREQEARVWRESLAKADPELRAAYLGCFEQDCDPSRIDPEVARRTLESAARDGSFGALVSLATSERVAIETAALDDRGAPVAIPYVNPSETDAYAWRVVAERLALQGCLGLWPNWAALVGGAAAAERELRPSQLAEARDRAADHWSRYGAKIAASRGCASDAR